ncbi:type II toxin-antitoxin system VapC family toxin [Cellulomonas sp.]|uniref:type II toxin-antitoxin system VapC family toxin n=1 Tax=Cellulomonas sp. TaxID=40001 RepID=UPI001B02A389|nr:type II toxin-antitoxin system VapC family toxin [Cellulomonas sp.]MBO9555347.1 type II toxin-antitoxin system VapC family toxin [Cellulomonas sp.]
MIVLDTNVLSEPLKQRPDERVLAWLDGLREPAAITSVSAGELLTGALALPDGRRRTLLVELIERTLVDFRGSVLPYDETAARHYSVMQTRRRQAGRPLPTEDGMIAATCAARGASLATRNTADFDLLGVPLIDPWLS